MAATVNGKALPPHLRPRVASKRTPNPESPVTIPCTSSREDSGISVNDKPLSPTTEDVRDKLSQLGVTVTSPKKATKNQSGHDPTEIELEPEFRGRPNQRGRGDRRERGAHGIGANPSYMSVAEAQSTTVPHQPPPTRGRGQRGNIRGGRWPGKNEIPKPDQKRWDATWRSSDGRSFSSSGANSGWGDDAKPAEAGFKLTDFNGGWAPAPIDWDARPGFRDAKKLSTVDLWLDDVDNNGAFVTHDVLIGAGDEVVPRTWVPSAVGKQSLRAFFSEMVASLSPAPLDESDLQDVKPWWTLYKDDTSLLLPYTHPAITGIDPDENKEERLAREADHGANHHAENKKRFEASKRAAQTEKRQRAKVRADERNKLVSNNAYTIEKIKPGLSIYVRSAKVSDMQQVREVYNYYVSSSCQVPETEKRTTLDMEQRYHAVVANKLPFLVACVRGRQLQGRKGKKKYQYGDGEGIWLPETIVGFATADDFQDMKGMYGFTCEVEVFTHQDYYMKGIASCLLDKLLNLLDPQYVERGGYEVEGDELDGTGAARTMENIIAHVPYEKPERLEWMSRWLKVMEFKQVAALDGIGKKAGQSVDLALFMRKTSTIIDPKNPPIPMQYPS
ncbi:hypothetical protein LTR78_001117 [Recurvomyces mirabilis]|uniref:Uncharacterized protein n=1 Tax=Recurvomyces mirabilis TaxID=574656 RepID=A0AAE0WVJ1_9PEZI|nr:hypothetical protein LTR78_001117 [Recurvomyces mirabilis]KAK5161092.1 hypothetical protein LTS14_000888 [Recurvomyces mirabilis]